MNPLDWSGPTFLAAYTVALFVTFFVALLVRRLLRVPSGAPQPQELDLDPYLVAVLNGLSSPLSAAVVSLVQSGALRCEGEALLPGKKLPAKAAPIERRVYETVLRAKGGLEDLVGATLAERERLADLARERGLVLTPQQLELVKDIPRLLFGVMLGLGVVKMAVGLMRERPIFFLVVETAVAAFIGMRILSQDEWRTRKGDEVLEEMRKGHEALRTTASDEGSARTMSAGQVALAAGLFGVGGLVFLEATALRSYLLPPDPVAGYGGGGDSGSSGSSCSSSSSCSSGCGGCGGGGGD